jgi:hypothetical protein
MQAPRQDKQFEVCVRMAQFIPSGQEPERKKPAAPIASESAKEAVKRAIDFIHATTPAQRGNIQKFFGANKEHAHMLVAAQRLPRGISLKEKESLLRQKLEHRR